MEPEPTYIQQLVGFVIGMSVFAVFIYAALCYNKRKKFEASPEGIKQTLKELNNTIYYYYERRTYDDERDFIGACRKANEYIESLTPAQRNQNEWTRRMCDSMQGLWMSVYTSLQ